MGVRQRPLAPAPIPAPVKSAPGKIAPVAAAARSSPVPVAAAAPDFDAALDRLGGLARNAKYRALQDLLPRLSDAQTQSLIARLAEDESLADVRDFLRDATAPLLAADPNGFAAWTKAALDERAAAQVLLFASENVAPGRAADWWRAMKAAWPMLPPGVADHFVSSLAERDARGAFLLLPSLDLTAAERQSAQIGVLGIWSQLDPAGALAALREMPDAAAAANLAPVALSTWYDEDPGAVERAVQTGALPEKFRAAAVAVLTEAKAADDPLAASAWLNVQDARFVDADAIVNLTRHLALIHPQEAMAWNQRLSPRALQDVNQADILRQWAGTDLAAARSYLRAHPLEDSSVQRQLESEWAGMGGGPVTIPGGP